MGLFGITKRIIMNLILAEWKLDLILFRNCLEKNPAYLVNRAELAGARQAPNKRPILPIQVENPLVRPVRNPRMASSIVETPNLLEIAALEKESESEDDDLHLFLTNSHHQ